MMRQRWKLSTNGRRKDLRAKQEQIDAESGAREKCSTSIGNKPNQQEQHCEESEDSIQHLRFYRFRFVELVPVAVYYKTGIPA